MSNTVIYINQDTIQLSRPVGKSSQECREIKLEQGTILNGVIVKEAEILQKLSAIDKQIFAKPITLVIDSSNLIIKKIETPDMPVKHLSSVVKGEIEVPNEDNYIFDYCLHESKKKQGHLLFGAAAQKEFIEKYVELFKKANIKIANIDIAINGVIKYVYSNDRLKNESFIINVIAENNMMLSMLFENGRFEMITRNRLIQERDTEEYVTELFSKVSAMLQYNKSKSEEFQIKKSYYVGVSEETVIELSAYADQLDIEIAPFMERHVNNDCFFACCGSKTAKDDIDLNEKFLAATQRARATTGDKLQVLGVIALAVLMAFWWFACIQKNSAVEKQIVPLQSYIDSQTVKDTLIEVEIIANATDAVQLEIDEYKDLLTKIAKSRVLDQAMLSRIYSQLQIDSVIYTFEDRLITISGTGFSNQEPADYAEMLRNSGYFSDLAYSGYSVSEEKDGGDAKYAFSIIAILKELVIESELENELENEVEATN